MSDIDIEELFKRAVEFGLKVKQKKAHDPRKPSHSRDLFDISAWEGWQPEMVKIRDSLVKNNRAQEVILRGLFKKRGDLGQNTIPVLKVVMVRDLPIGKKDLPPISQNFETCPWKIEFITFCESPSTLSKNVTLEI